MNFGPLSDGAQCLGAMQEVHDNGYVYMTLPLLQAIFVVHDHGAMQVGSANRPRTMQNGIEVTGMCGCRLDGWIGPNTGGLLRLETKTSSNSGRESPAGLQSEILV
jgi:hypothetical protein